MDTKIGTYYLGMSFYVKQFLNANVSVQSVQSESPNTETGYIADFITKPRRC